MSPQMVGTKTLLDPDKTDRHAFGVDPLLILLICVCSDVSTTPYAVVIETSRQSVYVFAERFVQKQQAFIDREKVQLGLPTSAEVRERAITLADAEDRHEAEGVTPVAVIDAEPDPEPEPVIGVPVLEADPTDPPPSVGPPACTAATAVTVVWRYGGTQMQQDFVSTDSAASLHGAVATLLESSGMVAASSAFVIRFRPAVGNPRPTAVPNDKGTSLLDIGLAVEPKVLVTVQLKPPPQAPESTPSATVDGSSQQNAEGGSGMDAELQPGNSQSPHKTPIRQCIM